MRKRKTEKCMCFCVCGHQTSTCSLSFSSAFSYILNKGKLFDQIFVQINETKQNQIAFEGNENVDSLGKENNNNTKWNYNIWLN